MNKERLGKLADWLEAGAPHETIKFDMRNGISIKSSFMPKNIQEYNACGSVCCIAGAAVQFFNEPFKKIEEMGEGSDFALSIRIEGQASLPWFYVRNTATDLLGIDWDTGGQLFLPWENPTADGEDYDGSQTDWFEVYSGADNPVLVGKVVRHLIETGEVDWSFCKEQVAA